MMEKVFICHYDNYLKYQYIYSADSLLKSSWIKKVWVNFDSMDKQAYHMVQSLVNCLLITLIRASEISNRAIVKLERLT